MKTNKILTLLKDGKVEKAFTLLYRIFPKVEKHICINSGSKAEAQDIFQEALIVLYNKVEANPDFVATEIEGFVLNTSRNLWNNQLRKKKVRKQSVTAVLDSMAATNSIANLELKEEKFKILATVIEELGEKCKSLLELFYFKKYSMEMIAKKFGYKAIQSAKAKKYKCMEHARKLAFNYSNSKNQ